MKLQMNKKEKEHSIIHKKTHATRQ